jgi:insulysin
MKTLFLATIFTASLYANYEVVPDQAHLQILTPDLAERKTVKIRLSNGLQAYLISDPGVKQSAAALAVEAGSWLDPKEYPGMAHFLEHMLFMGTKAYPEEAEYMRFIRDRGGAVNAYTSSDRTVYMFSINNEAYENALDRFSHFFIDPLFLPSCVGRELHAVDQEYGNYVENDPWRAEMILNETGNPNHPNAAFSCGNAATLSGIPQEALKNWYRDQYSANRMHLVVISPLPLEQLTSMVTTKFSRVPNHNLSSASYPFHLLSDQQRGHFIYIKPVRDLRSLVLTWQVPKEFALDQERKPSELLAYALTNGSKHSLIQELKNEKLAERIVARQSNYSKEIALFQIDISLTELGVQKISSVIERVFQTLASLKKTPFPPTIFDEMRKMALTNYQYQSRQDAFFFVKQAAAELMYEPLESYPLKTLIPTTYDPAFITAYLDTLVPDDCVFMVIADPRLTHVKPTLQEKWLSAEYTTKEIPSSEVTAWAEAKPNPRIALPLSNPFIPQNLALVPAAEESSPTLIAHDEGSQVYFAQDRKYLVPEVSMIFNLKTPLLDGTPKSRAAVDLYLYSLQEKLETSLFFGHYAGLSLSTKQQDLDIVLSASGYSDKMPLFLKTIFQELRQVQPSREEFEVYKQAVQSSYDSSSKELAVYQASELVSNILYSDFPTTVSKIKALKNLSYEEFLTFSGAVFKKAYLQSTFYGNLTQESAIHLWTDLKTTLASSPFPLSEQPKKSVLVLPGKQGPFCVAQNTERQGNGVVLALQEGSFSFERKGVQQLLSIALKDGFFDTLRTKQQTGYIAASWDLEAEKQLMQLFAVQSITHTPKELLARFELFLEDFNHNIHQKISQERFDTLRSMGIKTLERPPESLEGMGLRLNTLAFKHDGDFQWIEKRVEALKNLSYETFVQTTHEFLSRNNLRRLAVLMEGFLPPQNSFRYEEVSQDEIKGAGRYVTAK